MNLFRHDGYTTLNLKQYAIEVTKKQDTTSTFNKNVINNLIASVLRSEMKKYTKN